MLVKRIIRWSPFFVGLNDEQIAYIARVSEQTEVKTGDCFFVEGEELDTFYLVQKGSVNLTIGVPASNKEHKFVDQITRNMDMEQITVSTIREGNIFGWSAIIPPHTSTANAIAATDCQIVAVNYQDLKPVLENDFEFAYKIAIKAAQTTRSRLRESRMEGLAYK